MKRLVLSVWIACSLLLLSGRIGMGWLQPLQKTDAEAADLVATLLYGHPYVLSQDQQSRYDELLRTLRELASRRSDGVGRPRPVQTALAEVKETLLNELRGSSWVLPIDPDQGEARKSPRGQESIVFENLGPIDVPGDIGVLLLEIEPGQAATHYTVVDYDLSRRSLQNVSVEPGTTTWVLVDLQNVPQDPTSIRLQVKRDESTPLFIQAQVLPPRPGRLKVEILSDDSGKPVPAMVNLTWKKDGRPRAPSNIVDLAAQFDSQGNASSRRHAGLPGDLGGLFWWCVAGPFDMQLPPGEWDLKVRRGLEHIPYSTSFTVTSDETVERTIRPARWVDMPEHGWYSGDDHVHARIVSDDDADNLMTWARAEDLHLANIVKMGDIFRTFFQQRGFGKDFRVIDGDYILSPGQECPRTHQELGHTVSMNTTSMVRDTDKYFLYDWVFDTVHAQGGLAGYCHVASQAFHVHRDMSMNVAKGKADFVELLQFGRLGTELYYDFLNTGFKLTASAGSDVPWGGTVGEVRVYAYVGGGEFSADRWFEAVGQGRTFVTNGPMIEFKVDDALPGDQLTFSGDDGPATVRVHAAAWGHPDRMVPEKLQIVQQGEVIREAAPSPGSSRVELDFELPVASGFWIAARSDGSDGSKAHTTPVYVVREPLRFWKYEAVQDLIASRLESLGEIETLISDARERKRQGTAGYIQEELLKQSDALLERVAEARAIYSDLSKIATEEETLRQ